MNLLEQDMGLGGMVGGWWGLWEHGCAPQRSKSVFGPSLSMHPLQFDDCCVACCFEVWTILTAATRP
jgi:hypothetical protein